jgi:phosphate-selective porin OprO and OprP
MKIMKIPTLTATVTATIVICSTAGTDLHAQTSDPALNALVKKGILTEKEAKEALAETQAQAKSKPSGEIRTSWKDGLTYESPGGLFKGKLGGRIHFDIASFSEDDEVEARFGDIPAAAEFRRARLSLEGEIGTARPVFFKTEFDFAPSDVQFKDVYFGIDKIPFVGRIQGGHMKEPMGLEWMTSSKYLPFIERAAPVEAFGPERNIGVGVSGAKLNEQLTYAAGLFAETADSGKLTTIDSNYRATARVTGVPWYDEASKGAHLLHLGLSGSYIDPSDAGVRLRSRPEAHLAPRFVDTGTNSAIFADSDHSCLVNAEAAFVCGPFSVQGEYYRTWVSAAGASPAFDGFYIMGTWFITGEHRNYKRASGVFDRVFPEHNFTDGGIGAWELAVRYSYTDLNDEGVNGGRLNDITGGVNWYLNPNSKIQFNYVNAKVDRGTTEGTAHIFQGRFAVDF